MYQRPYSWTTKQVYELLQVRLRCPGHALHAPIADRLALKFTAPQALPLIAIIACCLYAHQTLSPC